MHNIVKHHRLLHALASAGIVAIAASTAISPAAASQEFPPNPAAAISTSCTTWLGAMIHIDYTNVGGQSAALFTTTVNGLAVDSQTVTADTTAAFDGQIPESVPVPVTITAPGMADIVTSVGPINCHSGTSTIHVDCVNNVPVMTATATNTGQTMTAAIFVVNGNNAMPSISSVAPGKTESFTATLQDGVPYTGSISFDQNQGTGADIAGTPNCVPPTTQTTIPPTTAPETTIPPTTVIVDAPSTTAVLTVPVASVLPSTGKSSAAIAWIGSLTLGLGFVTVGLARRPRRSRRTS